MLNRFERNLGFKGEAKLRYLDGEVQVVTPGAFVRCAVTGRAIPLDELRYWSVELQEAYIDADTSLTALRRDPSQACLIFCFDLRGEQRFDRAFILKL